MSDDESRGAVTVMEDSDLSQGLGKDGIARPCGGEKGILSTGKLPLVRRYRKPVEQLDLETGQVLHVFESGCHAARSLNVSSGYISQCCNGKKESAFGFKWRFSSGSHTGSTKTLVLS